VTLLDQLLAVPFRERDAWLDETLGFDPPPPDMPDLPRGAVPYLPSGVDEIITMVQEAPLRADDTFVDLGSGLGRVVILAHLLSGARALGIEIQEHLVRRARMHSAALGLCGVSFEHADATDVELDGSVFFLYAPFNATMLRRAMARVEAVARRRPIIVAAVGLEISVDWLVPRTTSCVSLVLYDSRAI
jgi:hypothetical protein